MKKVRNHFAVCVNEILKLKLINRLSDHKIKI